MTERETTVRSDPLVLVMSLSDLKRYLTVRVISGADISRFLTGAKAAGVEFITASFSFKEPPHV